LTPAKPSFSLEIPKYAWSPKQRSRYIGFVWGRSQLTKFETENHLITELKGSVAHLPKAQTCFFELKLPAYKTKEDLEYKLNYAIENDQGPVEDNENAGDGLDMIDEDMEEEE